MNSPLASKFCHLHVHSEYSIMDGTIVIKDLVKEVKKRGHTHIALTDHSNMHGAVEFYSAARSEGLTPIMGCEIYHAGQEKTQSALKESLKESYDDPFHLVVLAKNNEGYASLLRLVSSAYMGSNLKEVPVVSEKDLVTESCELVALSSCLRGEFGVLVQKLRQLVGSGELLFDTKDSKVGPLCGALKNHVEKMVQIFGEGNYYIELIDNNLLEQKLLLADLVQVARIFSLPLVATQDAHYLSEDFADTHALAIAIKNGLTMNDIRDRLRQADFHLASDKVMEERFSKWPEALSNTMEIAAKCSSVEIKMDTSYLPKINLPDGLTSEAVLKKLSYEGLEKRLKTLKNIYKDALTEEQIKVYWKRVDYELSVINDMGFPDYFLIVHDFIAWSKEQDIPVGPGRGSGAGSLVAYCLTITDIDPIPYNLIFERFLNPDRVSLPDFDIDFCQWRREEVINYCVKKYGSKNVAQITTFGKMQAKGAVKSVGRALNLGFNRVDRFTKLFPPDLGISLKEALEKEPRLQEEMRRDEALKECMDYALKLEGLVSHTSVHAAGLVISDGLMTNYVPVYTTDGEAFITQYEMKPSEKVGLVKFDFLGLKTLTVVDQTIKLMKSNKVVSDDFSIGEIPLADSKVYTMLSEGHTCGIFQCESTGMTQLIKKLKPSCFEDIIALVALFRPGPLGSGMVDDFIERKHGRQKIEYLHPLLEPVLLDTYGMILYQEQVQKIAASMANYTLGEADLLRRAMGKKIPEEMAKQRSRFLKGASDNKIDQTLAAKIFDLMAEFAKYGFNKSHSAAYGLVSYQTAYLKCYYPEQFLAASMTCDMDNTDKIKRYVEDCRRIGIKLLTPNIKESQSDFWVPRPKEISFALAAIKGVGSVAIKPLLDEMSKGGDFTSLCDLAKRVDLSKVGKKNLELLIGVGVFDCFQIRREDLVGLIPELVSFSLDLHETKAQGQVTLFDLAEDDGEDEGKEEETIIGAPWDEAKLRQRSGHRVWSLEGLFKEKTLLGVFVSAHPLFLFREDVMAFGSLIKNFPTLLQRSTGNSKRPRVNLSIVALLTAFNKRRTKKGSLMASFRLEQGYTYIEAVAFEKTLEHLEIPETNTFVCAKGVVDYNFDQTMIRFTLDEFKSLEEARVEGLKKLTLNFDSDEKVDPNKFIPILYQKTLENIGESKLDFVLRSQNAFAKIKPHEDYKIRPSDQFITALKELPLKNLKLSYVKA